MGRKRNQRAGSSLVEFTLVGIPMIFVLMSTFEMGRGMWIYHSVAHAVKEGTRYAAVHGASCSPPDNDCLKSTADVARRIRNSAIGLNPAQMSVTFTPGVGGATTRTLSEWMNETATWPPSGANTPGQNIQITATYPFQSVICMFWPGAGSVSGIATFNLPAAARERIQF